MAGLLTGNAPLHRRGRHRRRGPREERRNCRPGAKALVVDADHPDVVALMVMVTPADGLKLFISTKLVVYFVLS